MPRHGPIRLAGPVLALALAAGLAACAKREPPPGGPPDIEPPFIVSTFPDSGAARVPVTLEPSITFSEGMDPRSTEAAVSTVPFLDIARRRWKGRVLTLTLAESLGAGHTYMLTIANTARDRHGNPMRTGRTVVFTTGDSFPRGRIEGEIDGRGFSVSGTQLWVYNADRKGVPDSTARDYDAIGFAVDAGKFRVDGLAVPGRYRVWGFADLNHNHSFEPETDVLAPADTVIELTEERPLAANLRLTMTNPRAPGDVKGTVVDSLRDTTAVLRVLARSAADTTRYTLGGIDNEGAFELSLEAGTWEIRAFADLDRNRKWDPDREPATAPVKVVVAPASETTGIEFVIRPRSGEGP